MLSSDIRRSFLEFFQKNNHKIIESGSLIPQNDPTLLFTNAGMVQFKNIFTGLESREYKRATTSQKCIRAGGKHNELDQVGFTARHHTFFEMLGNFSFGDYFKEEAINFAWTFLTKELQLPKEKLLVTVYHTDEEAKSIWKKVAGDITIIPIPTSDNFWSMGDTGPCGPCTEIFYDHGDKVFGGMPGTPDEDGDRYMEIWNVVFMQFEQIKGGEKVPLSKKSIDTGIGLERIAGVIQGVCDNYQIDLFANIIEEIKSISDTNFEGTYPSYKVIADHIRSVSFLIAEGILPGNEGRGYVLRRILRRAMRHGNLIGIKDPFLFKLSDLLVDTMRDAYPELEKARRMIASTIHTEEEKFLNTLERGLKILESEKLRPGGVLSGDKAFKLYDTYGFPLDLTQDILKSENITVDIEGFNAALLEQKNRAKWVGSGEVKEDKIWHVLKTKLGTTEFVGYEEKTYRSEIVAIVKDGEEVSEISPESSGKIFLITKSTPFYSECGGQCADIGEIKSSSGVFRVTDTQKFCDIIAHEGEVVSGVFKISNKVAKQNEVDLEVNKERRTKICANHTATHLLQAALRSVLGDHVVQRGSCLDDTRLRFDFSHNSSISDADLLKIENMVNGWILQNLPVFSRTMPKDEAINSGAIALFGEKYADSVRVVSICDIGDRSDRLISLELCGGTHIAFTSKIGTFKILSEASIGSGVRRIEAVTREQALHYLWQKGQILDALTEKFKCTDSEVLKKVEDLLSELKQKNQKILLARNRTAMEHIQEFSGKNAVLYFVVVSDYDMNELRSLNNEIRLTKTSGIIVIANDDADKVSLVVSVGKDLQKQYNAGQILKSGLAPLNGKGGGSAEMAQGGGVGKVSEAIESIKNIFR